MGPSPSGRSTRPPTPAADRRNPGGHQPATDSRLEESTPLIEEVVEGPPSIEPAPSTDSIRPDRASSPIARWHPADVSVGF
jgi:hypothetical protein